MRRLFLVVSVAISIVIIGLFLSSASEAEAFVGLVSDAPIQFSPPTVTATDTLTFAHRTYLPLTFSNFPPVVQMPEREYLFVEYWTHSVLGVGCESLCIDFPTYNFNPQSGELTIYTTYPPDPALVLDDDEIGYIGSGERLGGVGGGASNSLTRIQQCPVSKTDITLHYMGEKGAIILEREGEMIVLDAGEDWVSDGQSETWDWLGAGCVVTSTHYITNYGFQDRDKIAYSYLPD